MLELNLWIIVARTKKRGSNDKAHTNFKSLTGSWKLVFLELSSSSPLVSTVRLQHNPIQNASCFLRCVCARISLTRQARISPFALAPASLRTPARTRSRKPKSSEYFVARSAARALSIDLLLCVTRSASVVAFLLSFFKPCIQSPAPLKSTAAATARRLRQKENKQSQ